jgi:hypothetical protein
MHSYTLGCSIFHYDNPEWNYWDIREIAHALSQICHFAGQIKTFYSVAQHSCEVASMLIHIGEPEAATWGLMHDAAESMLGDMISPVKRLVGAEYCLLEKAHLAQIARQFDLPATIPPIVKQVDRMVVAAEAHLWCHPEFARQLFPLSAEIREFMRLMAAPAASSQARDMFLMHYSEIFQVAL